MSATCPRCGAETETHWHTYEGCMNRQLANAKANLMELREAATVFAQCFPRGKYDSVLADRLRRLRDLLDRFERQDPL